MKRLVIGGAALACCAATAASSPVTMLAGRYYAQFADGMVTGEKYTGENIVEIVPVAADAAYVRVHLDYFNGHMCDISGIAKAEGQGLIYHSRQAPYTDGGKPCALSVTHAGASLRLDDGPAHSCKDYCGARGSLSNVTLPWVSKRPIRYLPKLKASSEYHDALTEWHTGKPANP